MKDKIHTAWALTRGSYRVRAFVQTSNGIKHSFAMGIGDTVEEAETDAIRAIKDMHDRDGVSHKTPSDVVRHGRLRGALVDASLFGDAPKMPSGHFDDQVPLRLA